jgi:hypothetical protein
LPSCLWSANRPTANGCGPSPAVSATERWLPIAVLVATGSAMASHFHLWSDGTLQVKLVLVALVAVLVVWHMRRPTMHVLEAAVFVLSLVIVWLRLSLAHGYS